MRPKPLRTSIPRTIIRLWPDHVKTDGLMDDLLASIRRHPGSCDELWFCTEWNYPSLSQHERLSELTARAAEKALACGILPGLQIANTMGHGDSFIWFAMDGADGFRRFTGHDGTSSASCFCPRGSELIEYYRQVSRIYARWRPSSVWIDDDLRMNQHRPVDWGCFCSSCVEEFSGRRHARYDRASLVKALNSETGGEVRRDWVAFNGDRMADLAGAIAGEFASASPDTRMALQFCGTDWSLYNARDFRGVFEAMHRATGRPVGARPGAGFYSDHAPRGMISKAFSLGRSASNMPDCVDMITPEVENFPHVAMGKTPHGTAVEASLDIALGCNSASFAVVCFATEPAAFYESIFERIAAFRPFWERYIDDSSGTVPAGLEAVLGERAVERVVAAGEEPFAWANANLTDLYRLSAIGLPITIDRRGRRGAILHGNAAVGLDDSEIRALLRGGVVMDGVSALALQARGFADELGVEVIEFPRKDCFERFTDDAMNQGFSGEYWRASLLGSSATRYAMIPMNPGVRRLGAYVDFSDREVEAAATAFESSAGGRVVILGRDPWEPIVSHALRLRLLRSADWVSRGRMPVIVETAVQAVVVPRVSEDGSLKSVFVLNATIDRLPSASLVLRGVVSAEMIWTTPDGPSTRIALRDTPDGRAAQIPPLAAWSVGFLSVP